ncbi:MAG: PhzF family phenazine biosynthesis protein [Actinobacteria bacterium]|nr:PhzF family phenazine biosynthesis protein [Actinomycetota bacterium]MCB9411769.1 PhzF family phenazine biosynthesis protein [Actinomycetota bacterium]
MVRTRPFAQVDVFSSAAPCSGNPVAVVVDAVGVDAGLMGAFTDWTNLSEATFMLPAEHPEADYRLRIFCPGRELPFAGHPTLGSAHAWLEAGGVPHGEVIVQECGAGLVRIRREGDSLFLAAPELNRGGPLPEDDIERLTSGLGLTRDDIVATSWCDNGPAWRGVLLASSETVAQVRPNTAVLGDWEVGVIGPRTDATPAATALDDQADPGDWLFDVRAFFPARGAVAEDPATGSLNAALAQWLIPAGLAPAAYVARQGTAVGADARIVVRSDGADVWVGGATRTIIEGVVAL